MADKYSFAADLGRKAAREAWARYGDLEKISRTPEAPPLTWQVAGGMQAYAHAYRNELHILNLIAEKAARCAE